MSNLREQIGTALRHERLAKKLRLREVADLTHISIGHISETERGIKGSLDTVELLCKALDVSLSDLLINDLSRAPETQPKVNSAPEGLTLLERMRKMDAERNARSSV